MVRNRLWCISTVAALLSACPVWLAQAQNATPGATAAAEDPNNTDYAGQLPRIAPTAPADAVATIRVLPGFRVEQVAAEPLVLDPVAMAFDEAGRLFIVEMCDYSEQEHDFVSLLVDSDEDGRFDRSTVYADHLSWPTAVICYDGGIGAASGHLVSQRQRWRWRGLRVRRKVFTGFGRDNVQGLLNSFAWGLDNRIHGATSSSGADVRKVANDGSISTDPPLSLRGRDFAFDPRSLKMTATSGGAQHGLSFDDWGEATVHRPHPAQGVR